MSKLIEIKVPDIGGFKDVPVIEVLVKPGDSVKKEDPLITLESDKATMEVPAPQSGVVKELRIRTGDKVSQGSLILMLEAGDGAAPAAQAPAASAAAPAAPAARAPVESKPAAPAAAAPVTPYAGPRGDFHAEVLVLGAGPGGYTAAFRAADLGKKVVLVERHATLGGVCLNVGCIPSKALLHVAKVLTESKDAAHAGIEFGTPKIDLARLRAWKAGVVGKLTKGLTGLAKQRKVEVVQGKAQFASPHLLKVETPQGAKTVSFDHCIIAAGSSIARIPGFPYDDKRMIDSTSALELAEVPKRLLVIGGGIIGLEMATVYDALGARISVVELMDSIIPGADKDIVR